MGFPIYNRDYCCCEMTQPTNEEIGYQYQVALQHWSKDFFKRKQKISSFISEDADYLHMNGITGIVSEMALCLT